MAVDKTNNGKDHKQVAPEGSQSWQCPVESFAYDDHNIPSVVDSRISLNIAQTI